MINKKRRVYLAGHMLTRGSQLQRAEEGDMIKALGHEVYNPMDNKDINDKANAAQLGLAERIVEQDTAGLMWSNTVVIEPLPEAIGSCVELGQLKGMKDLATEIRQIIDDGYWTEASERIIISRIDELCAKQTERQVLPHCSDIRRQNTSPQSGDRREYGQHQYIYGVCLDLTNGKGFYEMDEIEEELK